VPDPVKVRFSKLGITAVKRILEYVSGLEAPSEEALVPSFEWEEALKVLKDSECTITMSKGEQDLADLNRKALTALERFRIITKENADHIRGRIGAQGKPTAEEDLVKTINSSKDFLKFLERTVAGKFPVLKGEKYAFMLVDLFRDADTVTPAGLRRVTSYLASLSRVGEAEDEAALLERFSKLPDVSARKRILSYAFSQFAISQEARDASFEWEEATPPHGLEGKLALERLEEFSQLPEEVRTEILKTGPVDRRIRHLDFEQRKASVSAQLSLKLENQKAENFQKRWGNVKGYLTFEFFRTICAGDEWMRTIFEDPWDESETGLALKATCASQPGLFTVQLSLKDESSFFSFTTSTINIGGFKIGQSESRWMLSLENPEDRVILPGGQIATTVKKKLEKEKVFKKVVDHFETRKAAHIIQYPVNTLSASQGWKFFCDHLKTFLKKQEEYRKQENDLGIAFRRKFEKFYKWEQAFLEHVTGGNIGKPKGKNPSTSYSTLSGLLAFFWGAHLGLEQGQFHTQSGFVHLQVFFRALLWLEWKTLMSANKEAEFFRRVADKLREVARVSYQLQEKTSPGDWVEFIRETALQGGTPEAPKYVIFPVLGWEGHATAVHLTSKGNTVELHDSNFGQKSFETSFQTKKLEANRSHYTRFDLGSFEDVLKVNGKFQQFLESAGNWNQNDWGTLFEWKSAQDYMDKLKAKLGVSEPQAIPINQEEDQEDVHVAKLQATGNCGTHNIVKLGKLFLREIGFEDRELDGGLDAVGELLKLYGFDLREASYENLKWFSLTVTAPGILDVKVIQTGNLELTSSQLSIELEEKSLRCHWRKSELKDDAALQKLFKKTSIRFEAKDAIEAYANHQLDKRLKHLRSKLESVRSKSDMIRKVTFAKRQHT